VLSGPTFAHEVAAGPADRGDPGLRGPGARRALRERIAFRPSAPICTDDVAGAEIGGAVKNVLAIACGVVEGKGLGQNARAALIARGFAEMTRFGLAYGRAARDARPACPGSATSC
jgi:glycerol-3-phosphate dehydrogenase (NAD(P)+)